MSQGAMTKEIFIIAFLYLILASLQVSAQFDPCASCAFNAQCVNGRCVCPANYTGNPHVQCHLINNIYCQLLNDPSLTTFANEKVKVQVLGSTTFAQFTTKRTGGNQTCDFKLFASTERIRGKIFVKIIEFILVFPNVNNPSISVTLSLRLESSRQPNGSIVWQYFAGAQGSGTLTSSLQFIFNLCPIQLNVTLSRFVLVSIACCGIQLGLRPYTGDSSYPPGLFVEIDANSQPAFNNWSPSVEPLCLDQGSKTIADVQNVTSISDPSKAMTYLANTNALDWNYLNSIFNDYILSSNLRGCPVNRRSKLLNYIWFAFSSAPFIRCINTAPGKINLYTFINLSKSYVCNNSLPACLFTKAIAQNSCPLAQYPSLQPLYSSNCAPLP